MAQRGAEDRLERLYNAGYGREDMARMLRRTTGALSEQLTKLFANGTVSRRKRGSTYTKQEEQLITDMYETGVSYADIARETGRSKGAIAGEIAKFREQGKVASRRKDVPLTTQQKRMIRELGRAGIQIAEIQKAARRSETTIRRILDGAGIRVPLPGRGHLAGDQQRWTHGDRTRLAAMRHQGHTYEKIANALGRTEGAVMTEVSRRKKAGKSYPTLDREPPRTGYNQTIKRKAIAGILQGDPPTPITANHPKNERELRVVLRAVRAVQGADKGWYSRSPGWEQLIELARLPEETMKRLYDGELRVHETLTDKDDGKAPDPSPQRLEPGPPSQRSQEQQGIAIAL